VTPPRDDSELRGPSRLAPPRVPVVRLNRRVLYVVGATLVVVVVAGLVALRAQGSRLTQAAGEARTSHLSFAAGGYGPATRNATDERGGPYTGPCVTAGEDAERC